MERRKEAKEEEKGDDKCQEQRQNCQEDEKSMLFCGITNKPNTLTNS